MSSFFRGHRRRGSYDLFSSYNHFVPGWGDSLALAGLFMLGSIIGGSIMAGLKATVGQSLASEYGILIIYPVTFIPAMLYASVRSRLNEHRIDAAPLDKRLCGIKDSSLIVLACILATIATAYIVEPIGKLLPEMPQDMKDIMEQLLNGMPLWATLLCVSVFAPFFEELLCRGFILRGLLHKTSPLVAIGVSALFFALIHGNVWQAIPAFTLGALFGYVYYKTGSLKLTILMHCVNNTLAACVSKVPQFKDAETFMDVLSPWAYWSIYAACILILLSSLVILKRAQQPQDCQVCQHQ